jgi:DNA repair protein RadA/Sms
MAKFRVAFVCQTCGSRFPKWLGRCPDCGGWNSVVEELALPSASVLAFSPRPQGPQAVPNSPQAAPLSQRESGARGPRLATGFADVDRVLGGGVLEGSVVLLGGDPGIGKSTLVLQMLDRVGARGGSALYLSGEESPAQIQGRAERLGLTCKGVHVLAETELERMAAEVERLSPRLIVVDSIQTVRTQELDSIPGTVSQVRACAARFVGHAKATGAAVLLVGHVTKEGTLAGPRTLEHMVDVVLHLEGQDDRPYRILRCSKNRFGAINEAALFQMSATGMVPVDNPSSLYLQERVADAPGTVVFAGMEGTRPLLIEIQALVGDTSTAYARRTAVGVDPNRVALLQAVIEKHLGIPLAGLDVYVNVVGGLRLAEPALDAAVVAAMLSSIRRRALHPQTVIFGEVGLAGEVRGVTFAAERLAEAARLGFTRAVIPALRAAPGAGQPGGRPALGVWPGGLEARPVATVQALAEALFD